MALADPPDMKKRGSSYTDAAEAHEPLLTNSSTASGEDVSPDGRSGPVDRRSRMRRRIDAMVQQADSRPDILIDVDQHDSKAGLRQPSAASKAICADAGSQEFHGVVSDSDIEQQVCSLTLPIDYHTHVLHTAWSLPISQLRCGAHLARESSVLLSAGLRRRSYGADASQDDV